VSIEQKSGMARADSLLSAFLAEMRMLAGVTGHLGLEVLLCAR
jgi:hypothetical protein